MKILGLFLTFTLIVIQYSCLSLNTNTINIVDKKISLSGYVTFSDFKTKSDSVDKTSDTSIALIEMNSKEHNTIAMTTADSTGKFEFNKLINYSPKENDIFIIEATRRNKEDNKTSLRTNALWRNNKFETITTPNILINTKTTAISLISQLKSDKLSTIDTIGTIAESNNQLNIVNINESITSNYINEVNSLVEESVNNNTDPISDISLNNGNIVSNFKKYTNLISGCKDIINCSNYVIPQDSPIDTEPLPINLTSAVSNYISEYSYVIKNKSGNFAIVNEDKITIFDNNANVITPTTNVPIPYHEDRSSLVVKKILLSKDAFFIIYEVISYDYQYDPILMNYKNDYDNLYIQKYSFNFEELGERYLITDKGAFYEISADINNKDHLVLFYTGSDKFYRLQMFFEIFDLTNREKLSDKYLVVSTSEEVANIKAKINNNDTVAFSWCTKNSIYMSMFDKSGKQLIYSNIGSPQISTSSLYFNTTNSKINYMMELNDFGNIVVLYDNYQDKNYIKGKYFSKYSEFNFDFDNRASISESSNMKDIMIDKYGNFWFLWSQDFSYSTNETNEIREKYKDGLYTIKIDSSGNKNFDKINITKNYPVTNLNNGVFNSNFNIKDSYIVSINNETPRLIWKEYKYIQGRTYSYMTRKINKYGKEL